MKKVAAALLTAVILAVTAIPALADEAENPWLPCYQLFEAEGYEVVQPATKVGEVFNTNVGFDLFVDVFAKNYNAVASRKEFTVGDDKWTLYVISYVGTSSYEVFGFITTDVKCGPNAPHGYKLRRRPEER